MGNAEKRVERDSGVDFNLIRENKLRAKLNQRNSQIRYMRKMLRWVYSCIQHSGVPIPQELRNWLIAEGRKK